MSAKGARTGVVHVGRLARRAKIIRRQTNTVVGCAALSHSESRVLAGIATLPGDHRLIVVQVPVLRSRVRLLVFLWLLRHRGFVIMHGSV